MNNKKVTAEDMEKWLGTDNPEEEAIAILVDIANGEYSPELLQEEVLMYKDDTV